MAPSARPSDIYGPPGAQPRVLEPADEQKSTPHRPGRRWPLVAGVVAAALLAFGLLVAPDPDGFEHSPGFIDHVREDEAIAALSLYQEQATTLDRLVPPRSIYAAPGPDRLVRAVAQGTAAVRHRLEDARALGPDADPLAVSYWSSSAHDDLLLRLADHQHDAELIALLAAIHATLYDGAGLVSLPQADQELQSRLAMGRVPEELARWSAAVQAELEGADAQGEAVAWRDAVEGWWLERLGSLRPVEVATLSAYVDTLPAGVLRGLEGHPVASEALERLRHDQ